jgi:hypothetical protein
MIILELVEYIFVVLILSTAQINTKGIPFSKRYGKF